MLTLGFKGLRKRQPKTAQWSD